MQIEKFDVTLVDETHREVVASGVHRSPDQHWWVFLSESGDVVEKLAVEQVKEWMVIERK
jgi:hypothetical protein